MENFARLVQIRKDAERNAVRGRFLLRNYPYSHASYAAHIYIRRAAHGFNILAAAWHGSRTVQDRPGSIPVRAEMVQVERA